ncbi:hypothetical protein V1512DRAFT_287584 [Lipomyces arxii]|uniref:uncharacterized protein n=1 Tax=Lipomyces arxii TaxID=56418 RepID=UPI0034CD799A
MGLLGSIVSAVLGGSKKQDASEVVIDASPPPLSSASSSDGSLSPVSNTSASIDLYPKIVSPGMFFKYGNPGPQVDVDFRQEYIAAYDRRMRNPTYVVEHITPSSIRRTEGVDRKKSTFMENEMIPQKFRAKLADYFRSGYDRGHMAPAADAKFSQDAMDETFYLTNMAPQVGDGFNRDYWAHFEDFCRRLVYNYNSIRIVTGPLYLPKKCPDGKFRVSYEVIGNPPNIAVPTHFYKIIVGESPIKNPTSDQVAVGAFILPNEPIPNSTDLKSFYAPVDAIERASGLEFLASLPANKKKDLCREVECKIIVREFVKALPAPKPVLALPAPK